MFLICSASVYQSLQYVAWLMAHILRGRHWQRMHSKSLVGFLQLSGEAFVILGFPKVWAFSNLLCCFSSSVDRALAQKADGCDPFEGTHFLCLLTNFSYAAVSQNITCAISVQYAYVWLADPTPGITPLMRAATQLLKWVLKPLLVHAWAIYWTLYLASC